MHPNSTVRRENIPLDKIQVLDPSIKANLEKILQTIQAGGIDNYPWKKLLDSMNEGWDPACREQTYHCESVGYSPFRVIKKEINGEIIYVPENGKHRLVALRYLNIDPVDCFVLDQHGLDHVSIKTLNSFLVHMNQVVGGGQQYQSLVLPNGVKHQGRDTTMDVFHSSQWNDLHWYGKTVLDIGCHIGEVCLAAKRRGAKRVVGFDLDGKLIGLGKELSKILGLEVEYYHCDFWNFPLWGEQFDIVMAHQCLYHFNTVHRCENAINHTQDEMLDLVTGACKEDLFSYTFIHDDDKPTLDVEGYRPTITQFKADLTDRGFVHTEIKPLYPWSAKRAMLANKIVY